MKSKLLKSVVGAVKNLRTTLTKFLGHIVVWILQLTKRVVHLAIIIITLMMVIGLFVALAVIAFGFQSWILSNIVAPNGTIDNVSKMFTFILTIIGSFTAVYTFFKKIGSEDFNPLLKKLHALSLELGKKGSKKIEELYIETVVDINRTCNGLVIERFKTFSSLRNRKAKKELVDSLINDVTDLYRRKIDLSYLVLETYRKSFRIPVENVMNWFDALTLKVRTATGI